MMELRLNLTFSIIVACKAFKIYSLTLGTKEFSNLGTASTGA